MFYLTKSAPELTSESATNISKLMNAHVRVYVWELLVYVSWSRQLDIMYTHIGVMRFFTSQYM